MTINFFKCGLCSVSESQDIFQPLKSHLSVLKPGATLSGATPGDQNTIPCTMAPPPVFCCEFSFYLFLPLIYLKFIVNIF